MISKHTQYQHKKTGRKIIIIGFYTMKINGSETSCVLYQRCNNSIAKLGITEDELTKDYSIINQ